MTTAAISHVNEFSVTVSGERAAVWMKILGDNEVPVLSPVPSMVELPDHGRCRAYLIDIKALTGEQHARLALYLATAFQQPIDEVMDDLLSKGCPIPEEGCIVAVRSNRWFV